MSRNSGSGPGDASKSSSNNTNGYFNCFSGCFYLGGTSGEQVQGMRNKLQNHYDWYNESTNPVQKDEKRKLFMRDYQTFSAHNPEIKQEFEPLYKNLKK